MTSENQAMRYRRLAFYSEDVDRLNEQLNNFVKKSNAVSIHEIMRTDIATVDEETSLKTAAEILLNHKYGCLPVIGKGTLVGIVTEADFLRLTISLMDGLDEK